MKNISYSHTTTTTTIVKKRNSPHLYIYSILKNEPSFHDAIILPKKNRCCIPLEEKNREKLGFILISNFAEYL